MIYYRVTAYISIHSGTLGLSASQADARIHRLTPLGGNRYDVRDPPVCFKRGEVFGLEGALPKGMGQDVEEVEGFQVEERPEPGSKRKQK